MMPIIRPLTMQCDAPTEYQNEQDIFTKMKADLRQRKSLFRLPGLLFGRKKARSERIRMNSRCLDNHQSGPELVS